MEASAPAEHQAVEHTFPIGIVYNGVEKHEQVTRDEIMKVVLGRAIKIFNITQQPHLLSLFTEDGRELDDNSTVGQNDLTRKSVLHLRPGAVKGGARG